jgi:hypothetical protein
MTKIAIDLDTLNPQPETPAPGAPAEGIVDLDAPETGSISSLPERARKLPDGRVALVLAVPITLRVKRGGKEEDEVTRELTFRPIVGADLRQVAKLDGWDATAMMVHLLTAPAGTPRRLTEILLDAMSMTDFGAVSDVIGFLSGSGQRTGRSSPR